MSDTMDLAGITQKVEELYTATEETAVVFFDLASSTTYKNHREAVTSLVKIYRHNALVAGFVQAGSGKIVKLLGDGLLGVFPVHRPDDIEAPLSVVRRVLREFKGRNAALPREEKILSRVGISCGKVVDFTAVNPAGEQVADPQGPVVDLAARLSSMAAPEQALCDSHTVQLASEASIGFEFAGPELRAIRGFEERIPLFGLIWDRSAKGMPIPSGTPDLLPDGFLSPQFVIGRVREAQDLVHLTGLSHRHYCDDADLQSALVEAINENGDFCLKLVFLNPFSPFQDYATRITRRRSKNLQTEVLANIKRACVFFADLSDNVSIVCADYSMAIPYLLCDDTLYFSLPIWSSGGRKAQRKGVVNGPCFRVHVSSVLAERILSTVAEDTACDMPIGEIAAGKTSVEDALGKA